MAKVSEAFIGAVFGKLTVVTHTRVSRGQKGGTFHGCECICECGNTTKVHTSNLGKSTVSCGCWHKVKSITHGDSNSPTYNVWRQMLQRTCNPDHKYFTICKDRAPPMEWHSYENFLRDMGEKPKGLSLERVDNTKGYSKENCEWATKETQSNNKSTSLRVNYRGALYTIKELAELSNQPFYALKSRLERLWNVEDAVNLPFRAKPSTKLAVTPLTKLYPSS